MNLYFNDLTLTHDEAQDIELLRRFAHLFHVFSQMTGEQRVWVPTEVKNYIKSCSWTKENVLLWSWLNAAFGLMSQSVPYEPKEVESSFLVSRFLVRIGSQDVVCDQMGLGVLTKPKEARKSLTIGLSACEAWRKLVYTISQYDDITGRNMRDHLALCIVEVGQLKEPDVRDWCQCAYQIDLPRTDIAIQSKVIHLSDDHGKDVLMKLARRMVCSSYVLGIVNSLPFDSRAKSFIDAVMENGLVYVRLPQTVRGLGLVVKTTGRNLDETERIARILMAEYGS